MENGKQVNFNVKPETHNHLWSVRILEEEEKKKPAKMLMRPNLTNVHLNASKFFARFAFFPRIYIGGRIKVHECFKLFGWKIIGVSLCMYVTVCVFQKNATHSHMSVFTFCKR